MPHQIVLGRLDRLIGGFVDGQGLGTVAPAHTDVRLTDNDVVQQDIVFVSNERRNLVRGKHVAGAPDLVGFGGAAAPAALLAVSGWGGQRMLCVLEIRRLVLVSQAAKVFATGGTIPRDWQERKMREIVERVRGVARC